MVDIIHWNAFYRNKKLVRVAMHIFAFTIVVVQHMCCFERENFGDSNHKANIRTKKIAVYTPKHILVFVTFTYLFEKTKKHEKDFYANAIVY